VRTGRHIDRTDHPALAGELPIARISTAPVELAAATSRRQDEDDTLQWFVDLFVAEYASEASALPDASR
jgi:hypothetical protein